MTDIYETSYKRYDIGRYFEGMFSIFYNIADSQPFEAVATLATLTLEFWKEKWQHGLEVLCMHLMLRWLS
jgi:hypothetical protein